MYRCGGQGPRHSQSRLDCPAAWLGSWPSLHPARYDPPDEPKEYIHRVGRTARGAGGKGKALLFLMPEDARLLDLHGKLLGARFLALPAESWCPGVGIQLPTQQDCQYPVSARVPGT